MANYRFTNNGPQMRHQVPKVGILFIKGKPVIVQGKREVILCKADADLSYTVA